MKKNKTFPVTIVSSQTLEPWDYLTPWITGIGGSETSHIEMAQRLAKRKFNIYSYAPIFPGTTPIDSYNVRWLHSRDYETDLDGVYINYRDPTLCDKPKTKGQKWWFVAQDVDYPGHWTEERLAKIDRYICLCNEHARFTIKTYPSIKDRVYISSNGIRTDYIKNYLKKNKRKKIPQTLLYASSPDRGLRLLLEQWFRIREAFPETKLSVAYGFNNMEKVVEVMGGKDWRGPYQKHLEELLKQDGVYFTGRLNQKALYDKWHETSVWPYPSDWPETSCITCMEAQAFGTTPVTNKYWAVGENVYHGHMIRGIPQKNELTRTNWLQALYNELESPMTNKERKEMSDWALATYDWENIVTQWSNWLQEDFKAIC